MGWEGITWTLNLKDFGYMTRLLMFDNMEGAFHWTDVSYGGTTGDQWRAGFIDDDSFVDVKCLYIAPGPTTNDWVSLTRHTQLQAASRVALGLAWKFSGDIKVRFELGIYVDGVVSAPALTYDATADTWSYIASDGTETSITTQDLEPDSWHIVMFIADIANGVYVRAYSDERRLEILNAGFPIGVTAEGNGLRTTLRVDLVGTARGEARFDNVLVLRD